MQCPKCKSFVKPVGHTKTGRAIQCRRHGGIVVARPKRQWTTVLKRG